jgi:hypothetical protein
MSILNTIAKIKTAAANNAAEHRAKIDAANNAYADILRTSLTALNELDKIPADLLMELLAEIDSERATAGKRIGIALTPALVEPEKGKDGQRRDLLVPAEGGVYTLGSLRRRMGYLLQYLNRRTPGILPEKKVRVVETHAAPDNTPKSVQLAPAGESFDTPDVTFVGKVDGRTAVGKAMRKLAKNQQRA